MRSLKTTDKEQAKEMAYKVFAEVLQQSNATGSTSPKDIKALSRKYIAGYELLKKTGQKGGSDSNVKRQHNVIGGLLLRFCDYKNYKKPKDFPRDIASQYIEWRMEEGWKTTGLDKDGKQIKGANTRKVIPKESTVFNELQTLRKWSEYLVDEALLTAPFRIPARVDYVPPQDEDLNANPPFTPSDYKRITAAFRRWIKKNNDGYDKRTKQVIYQFFLISTSVGWRYCSEGIQMKWSGIKGYKSQTDVIKGEEKETLISKITINDTKRNKVRNGEFVHAEHILRLKEMYEQWAITEPSLKPTPNQWMFIDPKTGKRISESTVYDTFKEKILADCDLDRNDYTYYSTRKFMITTRLAEGAEPVILCRYTGHDIRIMMKHYARLNEEQSTGKATVIKYANKNQAGWQPVWG